MTPTALVCVGTGGIGEAVVPDQPAGTVFGTVGVVGVEDLPAKGVDAVGGDFIGRFN